MNTNQKLLDYKITFKIKTGEHVTLTYQEVLETLINRADIVQIRRDYLVPAYNTTSDEELMESLKTNNVYDVAGYGPNYFISKSVIEVLYQTIGNIVIPKKEKFPNDYKIVQKLFSITFFLDTMGKLERQTVEKKANSGCLGMFAILVTFTLSLLK